MSLKRRNKMTEKHTNLDAASDAYVATCDAYDATREARDAAEIAYDAARAAKIVAQLGGH
jgi:ABC-type transporter lipoprotein component MlaA